MSDYLLYGILVVCVLASIFAGRRAALYVAAIMMPMTQSMPTPVPLVSVATNLLLVALMFLRFVHAKGRKERPPLPLRTPLKLMIGMILIGLAIRGVTQLQGHNFVMPFTEAFKNTWYWITPFVLFWLVYGLVADETEARRVILCAQLSMALECLITIPEVLQYGRASAHLSEPNQAGTYFASASSFFLASFLMGRDRRKWLYLVGWVVGTNAVFNSLSRGAMVASALTGAVVALLFFLNPKTAMATKVFFVALVVFAVANFALFVPAKVVDRVMLTFGGSNVETVDPNKLDVSSEERLLYWSIAIELFKAGPYGYGVFTFPEMMYAYNTQDERKAAHNIYLQVLVELGIQGLIALLILVFSVLLKLFRLYAKGRTLEQRSLALALFGWWLAHSAAHFLVNSFFLVLVTGQFWIMLACLLTMDRLSGEAEAANSAAQGAAIQGKGRLQPAPARS